MMSQRNSAQTQKNWEEARAHIAAAAQATGMDAGLLAKIAYFESGHSFNSNARPISSNHAKNTVMQFDGVMAISSAHGYGQFINSTWHGMIKQHGEKYGVAHAATLTLEQANAPELRQDKALQAAMLAEFTKHNLDVARKYGGPDDAANAYAMHNLGETGGRKFLTALHNKPDAPVNTVLSDKIISRNSSLYGDGSISLTQAYQAMSKHMAQGEPYAADIKKLSNVTTTPANMNLVDEFLNSTQKTWDQWTGSTQPQNSPAQPHGKDVIDFAHKQFRQGYEYGRSDGNWASHPHANKTGNHRTDASRLGQDLDGDGLKGIDCSALVYFSLKGAGFNLGKIQAKEFATSTLFNGHQVTSYAKQRFDVVSGADAHQQRLQPGDIVMFKGKHGQHVGIVQGYDKEGHLQYFGSQVSSGPATVTVKPGGYWDGKHFEFLGALRPKAEMFEKNHAQTQKSDHPATTTAPATPFDRLAGMLQQALPHLPADALSNATHYLADKANKASLALHDIASVTTTHYQGKHLACACNADQSKTAIADVNKAIATQPAGQQAAHAVVQPNPAQATHAMRM